MTRAPGLVFLPVSQMSVWAVCCRLCGIILAVSLFSQHCHLSQTRRLYGNSRAQPNSRAAHRLLGFLVIVSGDSAGASCGHLSVFRRFPGLFVRSVEAARLDWSQDKNPFEWVIQCRKKKQRSDIRMDKMVHYVTQIGCIFVPFLKF